MTFKELNSLKRNINLRQLTFVGFPMEGTLDFSDLNDLDLIRVDLTKGQPLGIDSRINYAMSENAFFRWRPKQPRRVEIILPAMTGLETLFNDFWFRLACYIHGDTVYVSVFQRLVTGH